MRLLDTSFIIISKGLPYINTFLQYRLLLTIYCFLSITLIIIEKMIITTQNNRKLLLRY